MTEWIMAALHDLFCYVLLIFVHFRQFQEKKISSLNIYISPNLEDMLH